ncbi:MAG: tetratricopeptide repeat protein [candidate division Zixibacteria bacterium]|nr:tetratricopeptide repeat protein [candidate division Zixibacteria bacterium]
MVRALIITTLLLFIVSCSSQTTVIKTHPVDDAQQTINKGRHVSSYNHVKQGRRLYLIGKYTQATKHFIRAITNNRENWEAYYYMGLTQQKQNRYDRSISSFKNAAKYAPDILETHAQITFAMAISWEKEGHLERAQELYSKTLTLNPSHAPAKAGAERVQIKTRKGKKGKIHPKAF